MSASSLTEQLLARDRRIALGAMALLCVLAWAWIVAGAGMGMSAWQMSEAVLFPHQSTGMAMDGMIADGMGGDTMAATGGMATGDMGMDSMTRNGMAGDGMAMRAGETPGALVGRFALLTSMWWVMMIAMMLPSVAPLVLLHAKTVRRAISRGRMKGPVPSAAFLGGYLAVWLAFSMAAAALQMVLVRTELLSGMMMWSQDRWFSAAFLALAGLYQLSPLKQMCLAHCRSPAEYLAGHWRAGSAGAFRMGVDHGAYCVGCCWALMILLFVGGVMNIVWIAALAVLVFVEKYAASGRRVSQLLAAFLFVWAAATAMA